MKPYFAPLLIGGLLLISLPALACSCRAPETLTPQEALRDATAVFVGTVSRTSQSNEDATVIEEAEFRVTQAFKGVSVGETVAIRSSIAPGACGKSAVNDPVWLRELMPNGEEEAFPIDRRWVVYAYGRPPFELSMCSRSAPLNVGSAADDAKALERASTRPN